MNHTLVLNPIRHHLPERSEGWRRDLSLRLTLSLKLFWLFIFFISISALLIFYILQINFLTKEGYFLQSYEKRVSQLSGENETLKVNFSKANSLTNVDDYLSNQNFEKGRVKYIRILESSVAAK